MIAALMATAVVPQYTAADPSGWIIMVLCGVIATLTTALVTLFFMLRADNEKARVREDQLHADAKASVVAQIKIIEANTSSGTKAAEALQALANRVDEGFRELSRRRRGGEA